jgi:hypothetical protein
MWRASDPRPSPRPGQDRCHFPDRRTEPQGRSRDRGRTDRLPCTRRTRSSIMSMAASPEALHRQAHAGLADRLLRRHHHRELHDGLSRQFHLVGPHREERLCGEPELRQGSRARAKAQDAMGWNVSLSHTDERMRFTFTDDRNPTRSRACRSPDTLERTVTMRDRPGIDLQQHWRWRLFRAREACTRRLGTGSRGQGPGSASTIARYSASWSKADP